VGEGPHKGRFVWSGKNIWVAVPKNIGRAGN
jgi:hypothetical protein